MIHVLYVPVIIYRYSFLCYYYLFPDIIGKYIDFNTDIYSSTLTLRVADIISMVGFRTT
jgi:hypothetical protein